jgi:dTDP-4-dehydrorhamnose 3,5-epimerase
MQITPTAIPDVVMIEPRVFADDRGWFFESYNARDLASAIGLTSQFVQDNHSASLRNVIRGLHYQVRQPQGKLVRVVAGEIFDVAVDLRRSSPTFGKWVGAVMSADNKIQMWIPAGFAHGFATLSERAEVLYKATDFYAPEHEATIMWNDPTLAITWPVPGTPKLSAKDQQGARFDAAEVFD